MRSFNKSSLTSQIKSKTLEIGFEKVGILPAEPLREEGAFLKGWLDRDFHGEMKWMEREPEKRSDPRMLLPEAKSVIV